MKKYDIQYNGDTGQNHGVLLYEYPKIGQAKKNYGVYAIPGRNGELLSAEEYLGNINVTCTFSVVSKRFMTVVRDLKNWLSGTGKLKLSDMADTFYEVLKIEYGELERDAGNYGRFTVIFICYPYEFTEDGQAARSNLAYNPYDLCMPLYEITGDGVCTLTVNKRRMTADISKSLTIDTRKMIAWHKNGRPANTAVSGDYQDMWLPHGENEITVDHGFTLTVVPRWGYSA